MDEKSKNIWKKSLPLPQLFLVWLGLTMAIMLIIVGIMMVVHQPLIESNGAIGVLILGTVGATVFLAVWIFVRWLFCRRNRKRALFGLACLATLIALFYAEEDWRGKHDWEKFKREWEAKGEHFDFASVVPPSVPDDQNFALTPVVASCYDYILTRDGKKIPAEQRATNFVNRLDFNLGDVSWKTNATGYWAKQTTSNLKLWQDFYREQATKTNLFPVSPQPQSPAADVLLALSKYDATVEELRQASRLSQCRFPLNYDTECPADILLPHLAAMKRCSQVLQLRAIAELQNGQSEKALADVKLTLRLTETFRSEPFLISHLVRIAMTEIILQPIYEGLANHQWDDQQLVDLDAELVRLDYLADYQFAMRSERVFNAVIIDYLARGNRWQNYKMLMGNFAGDNDSDGGLVRKKLYAVGFWLMPDGWFEQNKLLIAKSQQAWIGNVIFPEKHLASPSKYTEIGLAQDHLFQNASRPWNFLSKELLPALGAFARKATREQISVDLARTAIALERCRLARGEFPESLDALAPQFIAKVPHDVIGGQLLKYRRTNDGQFVLYSVGWNEKDDGGVTGHRNGGTAPDFESGDWVWRYPKP